MNMGGPGIFPRNNSLLDMIANIYIYVGILLLRTLPGLYIYMVVFSVDAFFFFFFLLKD